MKISPCKNCARREKNCHGHCEEYIRWAEDRRRAYGRMKEATIALYTPSTTMQRMYWRNKKKGGK